MQFPLSLPKCLRAPVKQVIESEKGMTFSIHFSLMSSPDVKKALHVEKFKGANPGLLVLKKR